MRKVCVVTGSRAEYGLLRHLMQAIDDGPGMTLQTVVTGSHLEARFGHTVDAIIADSFAVAERVPLGLDDDSTLGAVDALTRAIGGLARAYARLAPDIVVVLGDRFEIFGAAQAAMLSRRPLAHIHGGEVTVGALDDAMRHAITKMANMHFVASADYRRRVIQLGEDPELVFDVGALACDCVAAVPKMTRAEIETEIGFKLGEKYFVVTYQPVTLADNRDGAGIDELLAALDAFPDYRVVLTGVNADPGNRRIHAAVTAYQAARTERVFFTHSLGERLYLNALRHCSAVVGNSSSGILEAPLFRVPTINIGDRQEGRLRAPSVIDCTEAQADIAAAIRRSQEAAHTATCRSFAYPFGGPGASARIADHLGAVDLARLGRKHFFDLPATA